MPTYTYRCPLDHETEHVCRMADKPESIPCGYTAADIGCGHLATDNGVYRVGLKGHEGNTPKDTVVHVTESSIDYPEVRCAICGWKDTITVHGNDPYPPCPDCDGVVTKPMGAPGAEAPGEYPRYDRGLGLTLTSDAHRRAVCKARGLTPVDGDFDIDRILGRITDDDAADAKAGDDYLFALENHPDYKDFRVLRAAGRYDSVLKRPPPPPIQLPVRTPSEKRAPAGMKRRKVIG